MHSVIFLACFMFVPQEQAASNVWTGEYHVYSRNWNGLYSHRYGKDVTWKIERDGDGWVLDSGRRSKLRKVGRKLNVTDLGDMVRVLSVHSEGNTRVLRADLCYESLYLVQGKVPKHWLMVGDVIPINPKLFTLKTASEMGQTAKEMPRSLQQAYSEFVRWNEGECDLTHWWLPGAVIRMQRKEVGRIGWPRNQNLMITDEFEDRFEPKLTGIIKYGPGSYELQTRRHTFYWTETKSQGWKIYRYVDKGHPVFRPRKT